MKDFTQKGHKVKSEVCDKKGAWTPVAMQVSRDADKAINSVLKKHKGKLSLLAIEKILMTSVNHNCCLQTALNAIL